MFLCFTCFRSRVESGRLLDLVDVLRRYLHRCREENGVLRKSEKTV